MTKLGVAVLSIGALAAGYFLLAARAPGVASPATESPKNTSVNVGPTLDAPRKRAARERGKVR